MLTSLVVLGSYLIVLFTTCFTFRFDRPVYTGFKKRRYVANIVIPVMATMALTGAMDALLVAAAAAVGVASPPLWVALICALIVVNVSISVLGLWQPVEARLIAKRLEAKGVTERQRRTGVCLGISDPTRRDWTKMMLEDDVRMLWIEHERLVYAGDVDEFNLAPHEVSEIERVVVKSSLGAYIGLRHIVLRLHDERRVRLHVEEAWTLWGLARATDGLAYRLDRWKRTSRPAAAVSA